MAAKKIEQRISKRTGKPVRTYTKPEAPAKKRGRKPTVETPRRARAKAEAAPRGRPRSPAADTTPKRRGRPRKSRELTPEQQAERDAILRAEAEQIETAAAAEDLIHGLRTRRMLESAGLMLPGVVGIVLADPKHVASALAAIEKAKNEREAAAARAKVEAAAAAEKKAKDDAQAAAEAAKAASDAAAAAAVPTPAAPPAPLADASAAS